MTQHELDRLMGREEFCRIMTVQEREEFCSGMTTQEQKEFCRIMAADESINSGYFSPEMWNNTAAKEVRTKYFYCQMILNKKERQRVHRQARTQAMQNGDIYRLTEHHLASQEGKCAHCDIILDKSERSTRPELDHKIPLTRSGRSTECSHCGHQWTPRSEHSPKRCPKCKFHYSFPSLHTIENTWLLCPPCHQAKTSIEGSRHILVKHRWKSIWLSRSKDGKWHLPHLQELADKACGIASVDPSRFPWCRRCKVVAAGYLMRPRRISSREVQTGGYGSTILDALRFYESINDHPSVGSLQPKLIEMGICPGCRRYFRDLARHMKTEKYSKERLNETLR